MGITQALFPQMTLAKTGENFKCVFSMNFYIVLLLIHANEFSQLMQVVVKTICSLAVIIDSRNMHMYLH